MYYAEPGSALESNLESNTSISSELQADEMVSPGVFIATSGDMDEQIIDMADSSFSSSLKSSDNDSTTSNGSEDDDKESGPPRPTSQDPFWLTNVDVTSQVFYSFFLN